MYKLKLFLTQSFIRGKMIDELVVKLTTKDKSRGILSYHGMQWYFYENKIMSEIKISDITDDEILSVIK